MRFDRGSFGAFWSSGPFWWPTPGHLATRSDCQLTQFPLWLCSVKNLQATLKPGTSWNMNESRSTGPFGGFLRSLSFWVRLCAGFVALSQATSQAPGISSDTNWNHVFSHFWHLFYQLLNILQAFWIIFNLQKVFPNSLYFRNFRRRSCPRVSVAWTQCLDFKGWLIMADPWDPHIWLMYHVIAMYSRHEESWFIDFASSKSLNCMLFAYNLNQSSSFVRATDGFAI